MTNKELVKQFYQQVFINGDIDKIPQYVVENYIQHNPRVETGREAFIDFFKNFLQLKPKFEIINICSEGDMVYILHKCTLADGSINKVCDIFRVENHKIVEHWDVIERGVEKIQSLNSNGIF